MRPTRLALSVMLFVHAAAASADEITDQVNQAMAAYARQDLATTITGLETALNLLRQARAEIYNKLLPAPPPDWKGEPPETMALGAVVMGGGEGASRKYHHLDQTVTVSIVADSPMLQMFSALASSGMAAAAGMRTVMIGQRPVFYMRNDNAYTAVVANHVVVRIEGDHNVPEPALRQFADAIDFAAIEHASH